MSHDVGRYNVGCVLFIRGVRTQAQVRLSHFLAVFPFDRISKQIYYKYSCYTVHCVCRQRLKPYLTMQLVINPCPFAKSINTYLKIYN